MNTEITRGQETVEAQSNLFRCLKKSGIMIDSKQIEETVESIGSFLGKPFSAEYFGETGVVQIGCETNDGSLKIAFSKETLIIGIRDEVGFGEFCSLSPIKNARRISFPSGLDSILSFRLEDGSDIRLCRKPGGVMGIEHFKKI